MRPQALFARIGGIPTLERVHRIFYDRLYAHDLMKLFFAGIDQRHIERRQTNFMAGNMGGPRRFAGLTPKSAHQHIYITEEIFDLRHGMLRDSIREAGVPDLLAMDWLRIDAAFRNVLVRQSPDECTPRYPGQAILRFVARANR